MSNDRSDSKLPPVSRRSFIKGVGGGVLVGAALSPKALVAQKAVAGGRLYGPGVVPITLRINGRDHRVEVEPRTTLLSVLRDQLDLTGTKLVCDRGACGGCTVLLGSKNVCSCMILALDAVGREITTIEGLARGASLDPLQESFVEHDALQCGFCTSGMIMSCKALLLSNPAPTQSDVRDAVSGNICRCGTYPRVFEATVAASRAVRGPAAPRSKKGA